MLREAIKNHHFEVEIIRRELLMRRGMTEAELEELKATQRITETSAAAI